MFADLEAHPEVPRMPAPCLPFDLGTMELLARIRAAALPSGSIIDIEDTPPITPIEDDRGSARGNEHLREKRGRAC